MRERENDEKQNFAIKNTKDTINQVLSCPLENVL